jgi:hypothetical protein
VDEGFVVRQARDADVEEAAEGEAEEDGEDGGQWDQVGFSDSTVVYGRWNGAGPGDGFEEGSAFSKWNDCRYFCTAAWIFVVDDPMTESVRYLLWGEPGRHRFGFFWRLMVDVAGLFGGSRDLLRRMSGSPAVLPGGSTPSL